MRTTKHAFASTLRKLFTCSLFLGLCQATTSSLLAIDAGDDFDAGSVDTNKWGMDFVEGSGILTQMNERLEHTVAKGSKGDLTLRPWVLTQFPTTNDWEIQVNLFNDGNLLKKKQYKSMGLEVRNWSDRYDFLYSELYATSFPDLPVSRGMYSALYTDDGFEGEADSYDQFGVLAVSNAAVRMTFDSATQVLTAYYDTNTVDGFQWILFGSIGIAGSGGADANTDWQMSNTDRFNVLLYGYGEKTICTSGQVYADDFVTTGGAGYVIPPTRLTAAFDGVSESCKQGATLVCKLKGKLVMTNGTTSPVDDTRVRVYLSSNSTFEDGIDTLIGTSQTGDLKIGKAKKLKVSADGNANNAGSFVLAVADNGDVLASFQLPGRTVAVYH